MKCPRCCAIFLNWPLISMLLNLSWNVLLWSPIHLTYRARVTFIEKDISSTSQNCANDSTTDQLTRVCDLLSKFYVNDDYPKSAKLPILSAFESLLRKMRSMYIDEDSLKMLFKLAVKLYWNIPKIWMIFYFKVLILFGSIVKQTWNSRAWARKAFLTAIFCKKSLQFLKQMICMMIYIKLLRYIDAHKLNRQMENINFNITKKANN